VRKQIQKFIVSGQHRTPTQDIEYAIRHLVEVAVRALSPGVNDPFTAMAVIDRLRGGLARLAKRQMLPETLQDQSGTTRIIRGSRRSRAPSTPLSIRSGRPGPKSLPF
jgi:uncharacterized membrane protein